MLIAFRSGGIVSVDRFGRPEHEEKSERSRVLGRFWLHLIEMDSFHIRTTANWVSTMELTLSNLYRDVCQVPKYRNANDDGFSPDLRLLGSGHKD